MLFGSNYWLWDDFIEYLKHRFLLRNKRIMFPYLRREEHIVLMQILLASAMASASASHFLVCTISFDSVVGFLPIFFWIYNLGITKNWLEFDLDPIFKVTAAENWKFTMGRIFVFSDNIVTSSLFLFLRGEKQLLRSYVSGCKVSCLHSSLQVDAVG